MAVSSLVAAGGGVTMKVAEFTSSGTWTAPSNCTAAEVFVVGGGGGGGAAIASAIVAGGGGGGGAVVKRTVPITGGSAYTVTVGTGGTRGIATGTSSITNAVVGGTSSFGSLITAYGGSGGVSMDQVNTGNYTFNTPTFGPGGGGAANPSTTTVGHCTGGGGGGAAIGVLRNNFTQSPSGTLAPITIVSTTYNTHPTYLAVNKSIQGSPGRNGQGNSTGNSDTSYVINTVGGYGIEGYGGGGGGGSAMNMTDTSVANITPYICLGVDGGGNGALRSNTQGTGATAGSNATANTGGGGGGAIVRSDDSTSRGASGGNGADGYVKIVYWS